MPTLTGGAEAAAGLLLVFFVPGYFLTRALFPEWRVVGADRLRRLLEVVTLSFVLSVVLTVLVGEVALSSFPGGFQASWGDPQLELVLAVVALLAFVVGISRGAYARTRRASPRPAPPDEEGAWELTRELERVASEERQLARRLRGLPPDSEAANAAHQRLEGLRARREQLGREREEAYAQ